MDFDRIKSIYVNSHEKAIHISLNIVYSIFILLLPLFYYPYESIFNIRFLFSMSWLILLFYFIARIKFRGKNQIYDILEACILSFIYVLLYTFTDKSTYFLILMHINTFILSIMLTFSGAITLSLLQIFLFILSQLILSKSDHIVFDWSIFGFLSEGIILGLLGYIMRASFRKTRIIEASYLDTIKAFVDALEAKDKYTLGHSIKVRKFSKLLAESLNLNKEEISNIEIAALLHDIGKIGIADSILNKKGSLTNEEFIEIKKHPITGEKILSSIKGLKKMLPLIRSHHERIDGKGYPDGLEDFEIPLGSKIIGIADAYDAMTSNRSYRTALDINEAINRLIQGKGTQFSSELVDKFIYILNSENKHENNLNIVKTNKNKKRFIKSYLLKSKNLFLVSSKLKKNILVSLVFLFIIPSISCILYIGSIAKGNIKALALNSNKKELQVLDSNINNYCNNIMNILIDNAYWNDLYDQIDIKDLEWFDENITDWLHDYFYIDKIIIADNDNSIIINYDYEEFDSKLLNKINKRLSYDAEALDSSFFDFCTINDEPYIIFAANILKSDVTGPKNGTFIIAKKIDESFLGKLSSSSNQKIYYYYDNNFISFIDNEDNNAEDFKIDVHNIEYILEKNTPTYLSNIEYKNIYYNIIPKFDILSSNITGYFISYKGNIFNQARNIVNVSTFLCVCFIIIISTIFLLYLFSAVISPINKLNDTLNDSMIKLIKIDNITNIDEINNIVKNINSLIINLRKNTEKK